MEKPSFRLREDRDRCKPPRGSRLRFTRGNIFLLPKHRRPSSGLRHGLVACGWGSYGRNATLAHRPVESNLTLRTGTPGKGIAIFVSAVWDVSCSSSCDRIVYLSASRLIGRRFPRRMSCIRSMPIGHRCSDSLGLEDYAAGHVGYTAYILLQTHKISPVSVPKKCLHFVCLVDNL